jgi:excisionase family DNA binding protein
MDLGRSEIQEAEFVKIICGEYGNQGFQFFDRHQSYTYAQAARFLGVSVRTVMREAKAERLVVHKVRGCTRIHGTDLLAYQQEGKLK